MSTLEDIIKSSEERLVKECARRTTHCAKCHEQLGTKYTEEKAEYLDGDPRIQRYCAKCCIERKKMRAKCRAYEKELELKKNAQQDGTLKRVWTVFITEDVWGYKPDYDRFMKDSPKLLSELYARYNLKSTKNIDWEKEKQ